MAQSKNFVGALFVLALILGSPSVLAGEIADLASNNAAKAADCNKQCEGKGTPADIGSCKAVCSLNEQYIYAVIKAGAYRQDCDKLKNDQSAFHLCEQKCLEKYERWVSQISQGQNL